MQLPLNLNPTYRSTLDIAFPVDILESNNCFDEEIFCHFYWQLCSYGEKQTVGFSHYNLMDNDWLFESVVLNPHSSEIIEDIYQALLNGFYVFTLLDEFYIPCRSAFKQYHYMHGNLIFGFEKESRQLLAAAYDNHGKYTATTFTDQEFLNGLSFKGNDSVYFSVVRAIKPRYETAFPKKIEIFRYYIAAYLYSFDGFINQTKDYGIQSVKIMAEHFSMTPGTLVPLYSLMEHKKIMHRRLALMHQYGYVSGDAVSEYQSVVDQAQTITMLYLKYQVTKQDQLKLKIRDRLLDLVHREQKTLNVILRETKTGATGLESISASR